MDEQENIERQKEVAFLRAHAEYISKFNRPYPCRYSQTPIEEITADIKKRIKENNPREVKRLRPGALD